MKASKENNRAASPHGASVIEYCLLLAFIALICIVGVTALGTPVSQKYSDAASGMLDN